MKAKVPLETLAEYDALLVKDMKLPAVASRPVSSVIQTVSVPGQIATARSRLSSLRLSWRRPPCL